MPVGAVTVYSHCRQDAHRGCVQPMWTEPRQQTSSSLPVGRLATVMIAVRLSGVAASMIRRGGLPSMGQAAACSMASAACSARVARLAV